MAICFAHDSLTSWSRGRCLERPTRTREDTSLRDALSVFDRLEAVLRQGGAAPIESCLAKVAMADRPAVLCLLVTLELAARRGRGERPLESEYLRRFPDQAVIIRAAFARSLSESESTRLSDDAGPAEGITRPLTSPSQDMRYSLPRAQIDSTESDGATLSHQADSSTDSGVWPVEGSARYSLSRFHKAGGLGEVWRARDHQLGREVALKRLKEDCVTQSAIRARFLREAWITGQLQHPGIVPVFELGSLPDVDEPFYTMRFIEGPTLSAAVADFHSKRQEGTTGPLDLRKLLGSFVSACQVVAYAHSRRVIHRDLKGQNIVLGDFGEVIVLDWGLAKVVGGAPRRQATRLANRPRWSLDRPLACAMRQSTARCWGLQPICLPNKPSAGSRSSTSEATFTGWEPSSTRS